MTMTFVSKGILEDYLHASKIFKIGRKACEQCSTPLCQSIESWLVNRDFPIGLDHHPQLIYINFGFCLIPEAIVNQQR